MYIGEKIESAYISNKSLADSIFESARLLLYWSGQQKTKVLASLKVGVQKLANVRRA